MKTPNDIRLLFSGLATAMGMSFQYGSSERILNRQSSDLNYPVLWLEKPTVQRIRSGGYKQRFDCAFVVLIACQPDDYTAIDQAQDESFMLTERILNRLGYGAEELNLYEFDREGAQSESLEGWSADADTGWRTEVSITAGVHCETDAYWQDTNWSDSSDYWADTYGAYTDNP